MNYWLSVKKILPQDNRAVLVYCPEYKNICLAYYESAKGTWSYFGGANGVLEHDVTHWAPLPLHWKDCLLGRN